VFLKDVLGREEVLKLEKEMGEAEGMEFVTIGNGDSFRAGTVRFTATRL